MTIDAYGTLVELDAPVPRLREALRRRGFEREESLVEAAFRAEVEHYQAHAREAGDASSLGALRRDCAGVFLAAAGVDLDGFVDDFMASLRFVPAAGARDAVTRLRRLGLELAVVSNWDCSLRDALAAASLDGFPVVITSAETGAEKPDPLLWQLALDRLGVAPERALHVGDSDVDAQGAAAAGLAFAPAPLAEAMAPWS